MGLLCQTDELLKRLRQSLLEAEHVIEETKKRIDRSQRLIRRVPPYPPRDMWTRQGGKDTLSRALSPRE